MLDDDRYEALRARDPRFDGVFFVGVQSTGIYCRPICPARTPGRARCVFFPRAASAEAAGFRACLRCRPERAPGDASVDAVPRLVRAAMARIDAGALRDGSLDDLARDLGVTARHLRRAAESVLGVSLVDYAQSRRVALARALLRDTALPVTEVAFAAGFHSVRRFNDAFLAQVGCAPGDLRRAARSAPDDGTLSLRLDHRPPLAWGPLWAFLAGRAIPGVERVGDGFYTRTVRLGDAAGWIRVTPAKEHTAVVLQVSRGLTPRLLELVAAVRHLFDLDAHPESVDAALATDPAMAARVAKTPGLRVPGAVDGFEMAVRAVLGQQVSVRAATTLAGRLVAAFGDVADDMPEGLSRWFPSPATMARVDVSALQKIGVTAARAETLSLLARAVHRGRVDLRPGGDPEAALDALTAIPGIGPWTAQYLAMRALRWPDAFPAEDLVVRKALGDVTATVARARAARWSPWRAYAVMHLWNSPTPQG